MLVDFGTGLQLCSPLQRLLNAVAYLLFIAGLRKVWICTDKLVQYQSQKGFRYTFKECSDQF